MKNIMLLGRRGHGMNKKILKKWILVNFILVLAMSMFEIFKMENTTKLFQIFFILLFLLPIDWYLLITIKTSTSLMKKRLYFIILCFITIIPVWSFFW